MCLRKISDCGINVLKLVFLIFNILFCACGLSILILACKVLSDETTSALVGVINESTGDFRFMAALVLLIIISVFMCFVGFLGFVGTLIGSGMLLAWYAAFVILVLLLQVLCGSLILTVKDQLEERMEEVLTAQLKDNLKANETEEFSIMSTWNVIQESMECCGSNGYRDYSNSTWKDTSDLTVPASCCLDPDKSDTVTSPCQEQAAKDFTGDITDLHTTGCSKVLMDWVNSHADSIIALAVGIAILQLVVVVLACLVHLCVFV